MADASKGTNSNSSDATLDIQSFHETTEECRVKDSRAEGSRGVFKELNDEFAAERFDCNVQCRQNLQRRISELELQVSKVKIAVDTFKTKIVESETECERLEEGNIEESDEIQTLNAQKTVLHYEVRKLLEENMRLDDENKKYRLENYKLKNKRNWLFRMLMPDKPPDVKLFDSPSTSIEQLQEENNKLKMKIEKLMEPSSLLPAEPTEQLGIKLFVIYDPCKYYVATRPEVRYHGRYSDFRDYVKCYIPDIRPGPMSFNKLCPKLQDLFEGPEIETIRQYRGSVAGRVVAMVTSRDSDGLPEHLKQIQFCDGDGTQLSYDEAGEPGWLEIRAAGRLFICGRGRRTVLWLYAN